MTAYVINRIPTPILHSTSPFEVFYGKVPFYYMLCNFGCLCFPYLHNYANNKLSPKSIPCVFVGYSTLHKRFRCLDHHTQCMYISRHVVFDETVFPFATSSSSSISYSITDHVFFFDFLVSSPSLSCSSSGSSLARSISTTPGPASSSLPNHPWPSYATDFVSYIPPSFVIASAPPPASPTSFLLLNW